MAQLVHPGQMAGTIRSLPELVRALDQETRPAGYTDAMLRVEISPEELAPYCQWNHRHYTRHCLHRTPAHELLLICYEEGQRTSIHDYDSQMAWIRPVLGVIQEERFGTAAAGHLVRRGRRLLHPGSLSYMAARNCIHRHGNAGHGRAATLNLYARPIRRWHVYDERTGLASLSGTTDTAAG